MKRIATVVLLASLGAAWAPAQEFANVAGLKDGLEAIRLQARALRQPRPARPHGRLGHHTPKAFQAETTRETPDVSQYRTLGMDISAWEKDIDWQKVKGAKLSFVYMKATEGADWVDEKFKANWAGAASAGLYEGAYHFYNFCKGGTAQADNFIRTVPREAGALPMVIDLEESGSCKKMPAKDAFLKDLAAFVGKVEAAYGLVPILYVNLGIYDQYLAGESDGYKLWIADPDHRSPRMPSGRSWTFWQYGWHGSVPGISAGEVDLDVFDGDARALAALAAPRVGAAAPREAPLASRRLER